MLIKCPLSPPRCPAVPLGHSHPFCQWSFLILYPQSMVELHLLLKDPLVCPHCVGLGAPGRAPSRWWGGRWGVCLLRRKEALYFMNPGLLEWYFLSLSISSEFHLLPGIWPLILCLACFLRFWLNYFFLNFLGKGKRWVFESWVVDTQFKKNLKAIIKNFLDHWPLVRI